MNGSRLGQLTRKTGVTIFTALAILSSAAAQEAPDIIWQQQGHSDRVNSVIFTPDGNTLISASSDRLIKFWNVADGSLLKTYNEHLSNVHSNASSWLSISPDGKRLANCMYGRVQLWHLEEDREQILWHSHEEYFPTGPGWVIQVAFSPDGNLLATSGWDKTVKIWNGVTGKLLATLEHTRDMRTAAFSPDGSILVAGGGDNIMHIWRTSDWVKIEAIPAHDAFILDFHFSPSGSLLASSSGDGTTKIWNTSNWALRNTLQGNDYVYTVRFSQNGALLATGGRGPNSLRIWRVSDGALLNTFAEADVNGLAFSPSGLLAYGQVNRNVTVARSAASPVSTLNISLTRSGAGGNLTAPAKITLTANVVASAGVAKVEFFEGAVKIGETLATPHRIALSDLSAGNYSFTAKVTDQTGAAATAIPIAITVQPANSNPNPSFVRAAYQGLVQSEPASHHTSGSFSLNSTTAGAFSGKMNIGIQRFSFRGRFNDDGTFSGVFRVPRGGEVDMTLQLHFPENETLLTGTVTDGNFTALLTGQRLIFHPRDHPAPNTGRYTIIFPANNDTPELGAPQGNGFGRATIDSGGRVRLAGVLADGTKYTQATILSNEGTWPAYGRLYGGNGSISGYVNVRDQVETSDMDGLLKWFRPENPPSRHHANGFSTEIALLGSRYSIAPRAPVLRLIEQPDNVNIIAGGGNLETELVKAASLAPNNRVLVDPHDPEKMKMVVAPASGMFRGTFIHPATGKRTRYSGAIFQKQNIAAGHFLGINQSGYVIVLPH